MEWIEVEMEMNDKLFFGIFIKSTVPILSILCNSIDIRTTKSMAAAPTGAASSPYNYYSGIRSIIVVVIIDRKSIQFS